MKKQKTDGPNYLIAARDIPCAEREKIKQESEDRKAKYKPIQDAIDAERKKIREEDKELMGVESDQEDA